MTNALKSNFKLHCLAYVLKLNMLYILGLGFLWGFCCFFEVYCHAILTEESTTDYRALDKGRMFFFGLTFSVLTFINAIETLLETHVCCMQLFKGIVQWLHLNTNACSRKDFINLLESS